MLFGNFDVGQMKTDLTLGDLDISFVPDNLVNNFFKSFNGSIHLSGLAGFCSSMLNGINCRYLKLSNMHIAMDTKNSKDMMIGRLHTDDLTGDLGMKPITTLISIYPIVLNI